MVNELRDLPRTVLTIIFPLVYPLLVIMLALYLKPAFDAVGILTISATIVPVIAVWAWIMHKREAESVEALTEGFKTSPERQSQALDDYVHLVRDKDEEKSQLLLSLVWQPSKRLPRAVCFRITSAR